MKAARIDDVVKNPDGSISVKYTAGDAPLPATWPGTGMNFATATDFVAQLSALEADIGGESKLPLLELAKGWKTDPSLGTTFLTTVKGKTVTLDLTGAVAPLTLG